MASSQSGDRGKGRKRLRCPTLKSPNPLCEGSKRHQRKILLHFPPKRTEGVREGKQSHHFVMVDVAQHEGQASSALESQVRSWPLWLSSLVVAYVGERGWGGRESKGDCFDIAFSPSNMEIYWEGSLLSYSSYKSGNWKHTTVAVGGEIVFSEKAKCRTDSDMYPEVHIGYPCRGNITDGCVLSLTSKSFVTSHVTRRRWYGILQNTNSLAPSPSLYEQAPLYHFAKRCGRQTLRSSMDAIAANVYTVKSRVYPPVGGSRVQTYVDKALDANRTLRTQVLNCEIEVVTCSDDDQQFHQAEQGNALSSRLANFFARYGSIAYSR
uniref:Uncharacterized protein n=1 Tax=Lotharella globosa TaxID=91324 RepID=A0A7S3YKE6_9EUKA